MSTIRDFERGQRVRPVRTTSRRSVARSRKPGLEILDGDEPGVKLKKRDPPRPRDKRAPARRSPAAGALTISEADSRMDGADDRPRPRAGQALPRPERALAGGWEKPWRSPRRPDDVRRDEVIPFSVAAARLDVRTGVGLAAATSWLFHRLVAGTLSSTTSRPPSLPSFARPSRSRGRDRCSSEELAHAPVRGGRMPPPLPAREVQRFLHRGSS